MSRSGYTYDDCFGEWSMICWRGAVTSAIRGKRGQAFLREMLTALDAMEDKRLIAEDLAQGSEVCAIGSVGQARGVDMSKLDPEDYTTIANTFGIAEAMAREIMYLNDDGAYSETAEMRYNRMRKWIETEIKA